jgi:hypothetical protein
MQELLQHVEWAGPSGGVVLVRDNDLFYSPPPGTGPVLQLTRTGVPGVVFNGVTDWLYRGQCCHIVLSGKKVFIELLWRKSSKITVAWGVVFPDSLFKG